MRLRFAIARLLLLVGAAPASAHAGDAEPPLPPAREVALQLGAGWRSDQLHLPNAGAASTGGSLSALGARGAWFGPGRHLGIAAHLQVARFGLARAEGTFSPEHLTVTGVDAGAGLGLRAGVGAPFLVAGSLGYGYAQIPSVLIGAGPAGDTRLAEGALRGHGPALGAAVRVALGARVGLELGAEATLLFGADYQGIALRPRRLSGQAGATLDLLDAGGARWALLASYQRAHTSAEGPGVEISQDLHQVGIGLRARWHAAAPLAPAPPPNPNPAPALAVIGGLVHAEGQPVAARITVAELALAVVCDARGAFRLEVKPGRYTLTIEAPGLVPQRKQVSAGPGEQHIYDIDLRRAAP